MPDPSKVASKGWGSRLSRCLECKKLFCPHPRLKVRQKTCTQRACRLAYRARYRRLYRRNNLQSESDSQEKTKSNQVPSFWKNYRAKNLHSTERNRAQTRLRSQLMRAGLQRQLDIVQVINPPGYFELFQGFAMSHRSLLTACQATRVA